jgi:hypothetical protein
MIVRQTSFCRHGRSISYAGCFQAITLRLIIQLEERTLDVARYCIALPPGLEPAAVHKCAKRANASLQTGVILIMR